MKSLSGTGRSRLVRGTVSLSAEHHAWGYLPTWVARSFLKLYTSFLVRARVKLSDSQRYGLWIRLHEPPLWELDRQRHEPVAGPSFCVLTTVRNDSEVSQLFKLLDSLERQTYSRWVLKVGCHDVEPRALDDVLAGHPKAEVQQRSLAGTVVGDDSWLVVVAAGGVLAPNTLFEFASKVIDHDILYADEDRITGAGQRSNPCFKPQWSPELFRCRDYLTGLFAMRASLATAIEPSLTPESHWYDILLRASEREGRFFRVPAVLLHRLSQDGPAPAADTEAVRSHLRRCGLSATVEMASPEGGARIHYPAPRDARVSIIIPNHNHAEDLCRCVESILSKTTFPNFEVLIAENHSDLSEMQPIYDRLADDPRVRVLPWTKPFNYSEINNDTAKAANGTHLLFLNNDVEVITHEWLDELLGFFQWDAVAATGAMLLYPDGSIQHAGVIVGPGGVAGHSHKHLDAESPGHCDRLRYPQNLSAVTGACLMVKRTAFEAIGGFDTGYPLAFNDVDLCLRLREKGGLVVWTPFAKLVHYESKTRGPEDSYEKQARALGEINRFKARWGVVLEEGDPYYHPHLTLQSEDFAIRL